MKLEATNRLQATQITAGGIESLPPRKKAITQKVIEILATAGLDPKFDRVFEGAVRLEVNKVAFLKIAKLLKSTFTFHGANHGTKGFMGYNFSIDGRSPFILCGWDGDTSLTINQDRTRWTPKNADLPEFSILALRQNLEALTGVNLRPLMSKKGDGITLKGVLSAKQTREQVIKALKPAGALKTVQTRLRSGAKVDRQVVYIKKAEAVASVVVVEGPATGRLELHIN